MCSLKLLIQHSSLYCKIYLPFFQMWMNVTWVPPALRGVTTHTALSFAVVTRAMSWGLMAFPVMVRDPLHLDSYYWYKTLPGFCANLMCFPFLFYFESLTLIKSEFATGQTSMSAATPVTSVSTSVSMNQGSSLVCAQRDTSCKAPDYARVSTPASISSQNQTATSLCFHKSRTESILNHLTAALFLSCCCSVQHHELFFLCRYKRMWNRCTSVH